MAFSLHFSSHWGCCLFDIFIISILIICLHVHVFQQIQGLLKDFTPDFGCYDSKVYNGGQGQGNIVAVARGNCTFVEKTDMAEKHGTKGVLIVSESQVCYRGVFLYGLSIIFGEL